MQIYEINKSVSKIGLRQGTLTTNVCTYSCNLGCNDCDKPYGVVASDDMSGSDFTTMTVDEILDEVADFGIKLVTITGGEPLIQKDIPELVAALLDEGYRVDIVTQGGDSLRVFESKVVDILSNDEALNKLQYVLDYKCPSKGVADKMVEANINFLIDNDSLIFQVSNTEDLSYMVSVLEEHEPPATIFVIARGISEQTILASIEESGLQQIRLTADYVVD